MPPVLGPRSPSRNRLWSCDDASGSTLRPSTITMKLASSPARKSSITTRAPASPIELSSSIASIAACASAVVVATTTPLPAARPSAFTTIGAPRSSTYACAAAASANVPVLRGRQAVPRHERLGEILGAFELRGGARRTEDRQPRRAERVDDAGGQRRLRSDHRQRDLVARDEVDQFGDRRAATLTSAGSRAVPALPGATNTFATRGLCAIFHASACSLPPPPTTRMFKGPPLALSVPEMAHAGEDHRDRRARRRRR